MKQELGHKRLFISPYSHDIIFSAFGSLINPPHTSRDALLVAVFSHSKPASSADLDVSDVFNSQKAEDETFIASYGCALTNLGIRKPTPPATKQAFSTHNTPNHVPTSKTVKEILRPVIIPYIGKCPIYIPCGISGHDEYSVVRDAVLDIIDDSELHHAANLLLFYEELPFVASQNDHELFSKIQMISKSKLVPLHIDISQSGDAKKGAMNLFKSQSSEKSIKHAIDYGKKVGGQGRMFERVWFQSGDQKQLIVDNLAWVSWEAARFLGGYTTLLANLSGSPVFQAAVGRTILIGPLYMPMDCDGYDPLETPQMIASGLSCDILYSPLHQHQGPQVSPEVAMAIRETERRHGVEIYYLRDRGTSSHSIERILLNFSACVTPKHTYSRSLQGFSKILEDSMGLDLGEPILQHSQMWETLYTAKSWTGINPSDNAIENSRRKALCNSDPRYYNHVDNNSLYGTLLAEPATEVMQAILGPYQTCVLVTQDTLSLPMAYKIHTARETGNFQNFKTLYYCGDIDPIRNLIDGYILPEVPLNSVGGFDWEGPIRSVIAKSVKKIEALGKANLLDLPALQHIASHGNMRIIQQGWRLDKVAAISDNVADELKFLDPGFSNLDDIPILYPGIVMVDCTRESKERSRQLLLSYASVVWDFKLDHTKTLIAAHTSRAIAGKGFSRDISIIQRLGEVLLDQGMSVLLIMITSWKNNGDAFVKSLLQSADAANNASSNVRVKIINEFHWPTQAERRSHPTALTRRDLHNATDISFGLSTYDTFAISPLEPISCGAICVLSTGCGCARRLQKLDGHETNVVVADYAEGLDDLLEVDDNDYEKLFEITHAQKSVLEERTTNRVAAELARMVPRSEEERGRSLERGIFLARQMNWDDEIARSVIPVLEEMFGKN